MSALSSKGSLSSCVKVFHRPNRVTDSSASRIASFSFPLDTIVDMKFRTVTSGKFLIKD
jgi:hypothetical protein